MRSLDDMGQDGHHQEHLSAAAHLSVSVWLAASVCAACGMVLCALNARLASQTQIWSALVSVLEALPSVSPGCAVRRIGDWCHGMSMCGGTCPLGRPFSPARQPREHEVVGCIVYIYMPVASLQIPNRSVLLMRVIPALGLCKLRKVSQSRTHDALLRHRVRSRSALPAIAAHASGSLVHGARVENLNVHFDS